MSEPSRSRRRWFEFSIWTMQLVLLLSPTSRADADDAPRAQLAPLNAKANQLRMRALRCFQSQQYTEAVAHLTAAIELEPEHARLYIDRGLAFRLKGELDKAIADYSEAIRLGYDVHGQRGEVYLRMGDYRAAEADYEAALDGEEKHAGGLPIVRSKLGWLLATCPDDGLRDGHRAIELATTACEQLKWEKFWAVDALAAACAETGDFGAATKWQVRAMKLAEGDKDFQAEAGKRLALYKQNKPWRDPASIKTLKIP
jgi:tetratricopeptide (TPR) repeat protein